MAVTIFRPGIRNVHIGGGVRIEQPGGAGNGLLNNLIAYWPGNEAAGDALDLHTNALHLTDINTVTSAAGLVYVTARQYTAATLEYHTRAGDDALLSLGDVDMTIAAWVYMDSQGIERPIASKGKPTTEWEFYFFPNVFVFGVRDIANSATAYLAATTFGAPALGVWYLVIASHDSTANLLTISVNNGPVDSLAWAGGIMNAANVFQIGRQTTSYWGGRIGPTMFWKSAAGAGGTLDAAKRLALWNGGLGLPYASFTT